MLAIGDRRAGATLVEALVVITILVMIGAIVFPDLRSGVGRATAQQAVAGLRADLRMARAQALTTGARVDLVVAEDGTGYGWTPGPRRVLVRGLMLRPAGTAASFFPDGSSSGGRLVLATKGRGFDIGLDPATGALEAAR
uniref:Type II secretion system protein H n=1 Tax=Caulobacter sp. (strain K31) TaxID=366602 RepID=B0T7N2_CAUSK